MAPLAPAVFWVACVSPLFFVSGMERRPLGQLRPDGMLLSLIDPDVR